MEKGEVWGSNPEVFLLMFSEAARLTTAPRRARVSLGFATAPPRLVCLAKCNSPATHDHGRRLGCVNRFQAWAPAGLKDSPRWPLGGTIAPM